MKVAIDPIGQFGLFAKNEFNTDVSSANRDLQMNCSQLSSFEFCFFEIESSWSGKFA